MLTIINLSKSYNSKKAVSNFSIQVSPGDIYGFIGHNGAGKTTTIKCIVGIQNAHFVYWALTVALRNDITSLVLKHCKSTKKSAISCKESGF